MWVRGLKLDASLRDITEAGVAPRVGAWIETLPEKRDANIRMSHPVWVRGLKPRYRCSMSFLACVAPRVGAWIETG